MTPEKKASMIEGNHVDIGRNKVIQDIARAVAAGTVLFGSGACGVVSLTVSEGGENKPIITSPGIPTKDPETNTDPTLANYELTPTPETTETMINPTPTYTVEASGDEFTLAQDELNQSEEALVQQDRIQRWLDYWIKFDDRPFAEESTDIHWKYIYDNAKNPKEVLVLLEVGGEYNGSLFTVPVNDEGFVDFPPAVVGSTIEAGLGPLEIDSNKDGTFLSVKDGVPVRLNSEGEVVEKLIKAQWESVEKYPIDLEKLATPPKSFEELQQHPEKFVQAPNPVENFEEFKKWYNETLFEKALGGNLDKLPVNYEVDGISIGDRVMAYNETEKEVLSVPKFFYFKNDGIYYPTYIVTVYDPKYDNKETYAISVAEITRGLGGDKSNQILKGLDGFKNFQFLFNIIDPFLKDEQLLADRGFGTVFPSSVGEIPISFGGIWFFE